MVACRLLHEIGTRAGGEREGEHAMRPRRSIATAIAAAALIASAEAQQFRTGVEVVRVDALVMAGRQPVTGLTAADFEVRDNGVAQTVSDLSFERLPLNIICVLDVSGSVQGEPL